jgi:hypothetical protein
MGKLAVEQAARARGLRNFGKEKSAPGLPPSPGDLNPGVLTANQSKTAVL